MILLSHGAIMADAFIIGAPRLSPAPRRASATPSSQWSHHPGGTGSSISILSSSSSSSSPEGNSSSDGNKAMYTVTFGEDSIEVLEGELLRTSLLKGGITPHNSGSTYINCRGLGTCGTCAVKVSEP